MALFDPHDPDMEKALHMAVRYLGIRPRSIQEMTRYLEKKNWDAPVISQVITHLKTYHYLDDDLFARLFIENRKEQSPRSRFVLAGELKQKGISSQIITDLLSDYDDDTMACQALAARYPRWRHLDPDARRQKAFNFLRYRGFGYDAMQSAWKTVAGDRDINRPAESG
jgi:regulatory protein